MLLEAFHGQVRLSNANVPAGGTHERDGRLRRSYRWTLNPGLLAPGRWLW